MTEAEWLASADPTPMRILIGQTASDRKLRLFAVGSCRRLWHLLVDPRSRAAIECAEGFADGTAAEEERIASARAAHSAKDTVAHASRDGHATTAARLAYEVCRNPGSSAASNLVWYASE